MLISWKVWSFKERRKWGRNYWCWRGFCSPENIEVEDAMMMVLRLYLACYFHLLVLESFQLTFIVLEL
ncbi:hypothetical protein Hanom_Chr12g01151021 [Helianthus anomalus]